MSYGNTSKNSMTTRRIDSSTISFFFSVYHISEVSHTPFPHHLPNSHNRNYTIQYDISFSCEYYSPTIQSLKSFSFYKTIHFEPYTCLTTSFPILLQSHVTRYQIYSHLTSINASPYPFVYTINIYILTQNDINCEFFSTLLNFPSSFPIILLTTNECVALGLIHAYKSKEFNCNISATTRLVMPSNLSDVFAHNEHSEDKWWSFILKTL